MRARDKIKAFNQKFKNNEDKRVEKKELKQLIKEKEGKGGY